MTWSSRQLLNRRFMHKMNQEDAFVTGYFFVWIPVPDAIAKTFTELFAPDKYNLVGTDPTDMSMMLSALVTGLPSIPETTLNQNSMPSMGGTKWGVATNIDHPTTMSLKFRELSGLPVCKTITSWFTTMRDPNSGISVLQGDEYTKKNWSSEIILAYVKPDGATIEGATRFEGSYPLKYPTDLFTSDAATVDPLEPEIEFHVDSIWSDAGALESARSIMDVFKAAKPYHKLGGMTIYGTDTNASSNQ